MQPQQPHYGNNMVYCQLFYLIITKKNYARCIFGVDGCDIRCHTRRTTRRVNPHTLLHYLTRLSGPLVGSLFLCLEGLPYTFAGKPIPITLKIQKTCRDCIANAGGPQWPMRTCTGANIFLYIADVATVDLPDKLAPVTPHRTPQRLTRPHPLASAFCHLSYC